MSQRIIPGVGTLQYTEQPRREYWLLPEGASRRRRLPSVTTVLGEVIAKPGLVAWAAGLGAAYPRAREEAAARGHAVHQFIEHYLRHGELLELDDEHAPWAQAAARWLWDHDPRAVEVELLVCHPEFAYAGRLDLIAEIAGTVTLLDFKTNAKATVRASAHIQAYAYELANERCGGPVVERSLLVGISDHGQYTVVERADTAKTWGAALALYGELRKLERSLNGGDGGEQS
jgi:hypothetical protein